MVKDLIEALTIFAKYQRETRWPTVCSHDLMSIVGVTLDEVTSDDAKRLEELGFFWSEYEESWQSYRFGSA